MLSPWVAIFLLFSAGIAIAYHGLWYGLIIILFLMFTAWLRYPQRGKEISAALVIVGLGLICLQLRSADEIADPAVAGEGVINGVIMDYPVRQGDRTSFRLQNSADSPQLKYVQVYCHFSADLNRGDQVTLQGKLQVPDKPGNPGEFDYCTYLKHQRVFYIISVEGETGIINTTPVRGITQKINSCRSRTEEMVYRLMPETEAQIFLGMLLGEKENIDPDRYEVFQKTGIVHIFAVSGLHIGIIVLFLSYCTSLLLKSKGIRFLLVIGFLLLYGSLIGWPISVQRAVIMASLALLANYHGRQNGAGNSLGLAGMLIIVMDPYALFTISFQLSFMAAWGLVCLYPALKDYWQYQNRVWDIVLIPLCAQLAVIPLLVYYFNLFSPVALISNIMVSCLIAAVVICGFLALLLVYFPPLAVLFLYPAGFMIEILTRAADIFVRIPGGCLWVKTPDLETMALYYLALLMLLAAFYYSWPRQRVWTALTVLSLGMLLICLPPGLFRYGILEVVFLDVGQGDSIFIKTPRGKFILLDGGGSHFYSVSAKKILPYLRHRGVREIYLMINSHPDSDHLKGWTETAEKMPFRYVMVPASLFQAEEYDEVKEIARQRGAEVLGAAAGQHINIEAGLNIEVLYPPAYMGNGDYNQQSLVLRLEYGDFSLLMPGDLEKEGLEQLAASDRVQPTLLVKVPHHGSRGALLEDFYEKLGPYAAIISAGKNNIYGHPAREVLDYLEEQGILVLRTDMDGAVSLESDGQNLVIDCFRR
jgi:competence protein ComEC